MGMRMAENISYYIFTVIVDHLRRRRTSTMDKAVILKVLLIGAAIQFFVVPAIGALSDRVGRRPLYLIGAVGVGRLDVRLLRPARHQAARTRSCSPSSSACSSTR